MDAQIERLLAWAAAEDSGQDFNTDDAERLYHIAAFAYLDNVVPSQEEVKTRLVTFGCAVQKATFLSQQFTHFCEIFKSCLPQPEIGDLYGGTH